MGAGKLLGTVCSGKLSVTGVAENSWETVGAGKLLVTIGAGKPLVTVGAGKLLLTGGVGNKKLLGTVGLGSSWKTVSAENRSSWENVGGGN